MSKKPVEVFEEVEVEDEGEESDEYEVEEDDEDYAEEEEEEGVAGPSGSLTALLLGGEGQGGQEAEEEEEEGEDEEYGKELQVPGTNGANGALSVPSSISGVKRGRDEDDAAEPEIRAGSTPGGELQGDYGEADEVAASAAKKARTEAAVAKEEGL